MARPKSTSTTKRIVKAPGVKPRRGRPPKSASATTKATRKKTSVKRKASAKAPSMTIRMRELKQESRIAIRVLKAEVAGLKKELSDAQRREAKLVKVFDAKEKAVAAYGEKWLAKALKGTAKKKVVRRRRKSKMA